MGALKKLLLCLLPALLLTLAACAGTPEETTAAPVPSGKADAGTVTAVETTAAEETAAAPETEPAEDGTLPEVPGLEAYTETRNLYGVEDLSALSDEEILARLEAADAGDLPEEAPETPEEEYDLEVLEEITKDSVFTDEPWQDLDEEVSMPMGPEGPDSPAQTGTDMPAGNYPTLPESAQTFRDGDDWVAMYPGGEAEFIDAVAQMKALGFTLDAEEETVMGIRMYEAEDAAGRDGSVMLTGQSITIEIDE